jgi:hypothetical protein
MAVLGASLPALLLVGCGRGHAPAREAGVTPADAAPADDSVGPETSVAQRADAPPSDALDALDAADAADAADAPDAPELPTGCDAGVDGGAWQLLGGPLGAADNPAAFAPALALGDGDQPVVAWYEGKKVFTRAWTQTGCDGAWRDLGPPVDGGFPTLVSDARGLLRAYLRLEGSQVIVERWNGSAFVAVGAPLDATQKLAEAFAPSVITDADGNPIVAWDDDGARPNVQVARWSGTEWQALTDANGVIGDIVYGYSYDFHPVSLARAPDGALFVAWAGREKATMVARFSDGTTWTEVGSPLATYGKALEYGGPIVRVDAAGAVFVASLTRLANADTAHGVVFELQNGAWAPLGAGPWPSGQEFDLVLDGAEPLLVSVEPFEDKSRSLPMYRWSGASWQTLATAPPVTDQIKARTPQLSIDGRGRFVMAWSEPTGNKDGLAPGIIRVARTTSPLAP